MQHPPCWLTGRAVDELQKGEHLEAFTRLHKEFIDAFEKEERLLSPTKHSALGPVWLAHAKKTAPY